MIEWAFLATASTLASSLLEKSRDGFLSNQSDRTILQLLAKISSKLKTQSPADNYEIAKSFRRACLIAAKQICDSRKTNISGQSILVPRHNIAQRFLGITPSSLFAEVEQQWLARLEQFLNNEIEALDQDKVFISELGDKSYQTLVNYKGANQEWADQFKQQITADMIIEVSEAVGEPPNIILEELENRWFVQTCKEFQKTLNSNPVLANNFQNSMLVKLDSGQEITIAILSEMFNFLRESISFQTTEMPKVVGLFQERTLFVNRNEERNRLFKWLTESSKKVIVIKAASGYGKTSLVTDILYKLSPDHKSLDERLAAILYFRCSNNEGTFREVCKKVDACLGRKENTFENRINKIVFEAQESEEILLDEIIKDITEELSKLGNVWLIFDNFETVLTTNQIKEPYLRTFFEEALQVHGLHFLLTSQKVPQFENRVDIEQVKIEVLSEDFALELLQKEGIKLKESNDKIDFGLAEITKEDLRKLKQLGFSCVPMALVALIGYLEAAYKKYGETLSKVLDDKNLFEKFRDYDAQRGSMYLIERQYYALCEEERLTLKAVSSFQQAVEFPVLVEVLKGKLEENTIYDILSNNTLVKRIGANYYELLPQAKEVISQHPDQPTDLLSRRELHQKAAHFYYLARKPLNECYRIEDFNAYFNEIYHLYHAGFYNRIVIICADIVEKVNILGYGTKIIDIGNSIEHRLSSIELECENYFSMGIAYTNSKIRDDVSIVFQKGIKLVKKLIRLEDNSDKKYNLRFRLAAYYSNNAAVFIHLKNKEEALKLIDRAFRLFGRLIKDNTDKKDEITIALIKNSVNKSSLLFEMGKLKQSFNLNEKTIKILEKMSVSDFPDYENVLAVAYNLRGLIIKRSGRLRDSIQDVQRAIENREILVKSKGKKEFEGLLLVDYQSKVRLLIDLGELEEAIKLVDTCIEAQEQLVKEQEVSELNKGLASVYYNKGEILYKLSDYKKSAAFFDKAINLLKQLMKIKKGDDVRNSLIESHIGKGNALDHNKDSTSAIIEYDEAITLLSQSEDYNDDLHKIAITGNAYFNKASTLFGLGRFNEALDNSDKSINLFKKVIKENDNKSVKILLSMALSVKAKAMEKVGKSIEGSEYIDESVEILNEFLIENNYHFLPELTDSVRLRIEFYLNQELWSLAAKDIIYFFDTMILANENKDVSQHHKFLIRNNFFRIILNIRKLQDQQKQIVLSLSGKYGKSLRNVVDSSLIIKDDDTEI